MFGIKKKEVPETVKYYKRWRNGHYALKYGAYPIAVIPETILTAIKWEDWANACGNNWSLGLGFTTAVIGALLAVFLVSKKQKLFENKISGLFGLSLVIMIWAIACLFIGKISTEIGYMLACVSLGCAMGGASETIDLYTVNPTYEEYKALYNGGFNARLNKKLAKKQKREEKAKQELEDLKDLSRRAVD